MATWCHHSIGLTIFQANFLNICLNRRLVVQAVYIKTCAGWPSTYPVWGAEAVLIDLLNPLWPRLLHFSQSWLWSQPDYGSLDGKELLIGTAIGSSCRWWRSLSGSPPFSIFQPRRWASPVEPHFVCLRFAVVRCPTLNKCYTHCNIVTCSKLLAKLIGFNFIKT